MSVEPVGIRLDDEPTPSARVRSREDLADYLLDIGATLAAYGCPSYRLEDVIRLIADVEGHRADPFALPTGLFLRVTAKDGRHSHSSTATSATSPTRPAAPTSERRQRLKQYGFG